MTWWFGAVHPSADGPAAHADHILLSIMDKLAADLVCTHVDRTGVVASTAMTARLRREPSAADIAALSEQLGPVTPVAGPPDGGRCVRFPGQEALTGIMPVADVIASSAIDEVVGIGVPITPDTSVDTRGFLRPVFAGDRLVLLVEPAAGDIPRPVEIADPHQCCGGH
jgi:hypothetical protein